MVNEHMIDLAEDFDTTPFHDTNNRRGPGMKLTTEGKLCQSMFLLFKSGELIGSDPSCQPVYPELLLQTGPSGDQSYWNSGGSAGRVGFITAIAAPDGHKCTPLKVFSRGSNPNQKHAKVPVRNGSLLTFGYFEGKEAMLTLWVVKETCWLEKANDGEGAVGASINLLSVFTDNPANGVAPTWASSAFDVTDIVIKSFLCEAWASMKKFNSEMSCWINPWLRKQGTQGGQATEDKRGFEHPYGMNQEEKAEMDATATASIDPKILCDDWDKMVGTMTTSMSDALYEAGKTSRNATPRGQCLTFITDASKIEGSSYAPGTLVITNYLVVRFFASGADHKAVPAGQAYIADKYVYIWAPDDNVPYLLGNPSKAIDRTLVNTHVDKTGRFITAHNYQGC